MSRKKSKIRVKRKQTKKKRSKKGGTLTPSQKREKMLKLEELERKMKELRLKKQKTIRLKKREEKEHKKQELQRNISADRAKIPDFEERIRNLTLKVAVRSVRPIGISRRSSKKKTKPTKESGEGLEFKKEPVKEKVDYTTKTDDEIIRIAAKI